MRAILWCLLVGVLAAGCTPDQPDAATGSVSTLSPPPPVTRPLDPSAYATAGAVCDLLTEDQILAFDLPRIAKPHKRTDTVFDCSRERKGDERWQIDYTLWLDVDLVDTWYSVEGDDYELRYIAGYPGAVHEAEDGWFCDVAVTIAERKSIQVAGSDIRREAACSQVIPVAERMVRNLEG